MIQIMTIREEVLRRLIYIAWAIIHDGHYRRLPPRPPSEIMTRAELTILLRRLPYLLAGKLSEDTDAEDWILDICAMINMADEPMRSRLIQYGVLNEHYSRPYHLVRNGIITRTDQLWGAEFDSEKEETVELAPAREREVPGKWDRSTRDFERITQVTHDREFRIEAHERSFADMSPSEQLQYDNAKHGYYAAQGHLLRKLNPPHLPLEPIPLLLRFDRGQVCDRDEQAAIISPEPALPRALSLAAQPTAIA